MTKSMKKIALKRFLYDHRLHHLKFNRFSTVSTCAGCIPHRYDERSSHWVWVDLLDCTRTSAAMMTLGKKVCCILVPDWLSEQSQPSMALVDLAPEWLVDALDRSIPITESLYDAILGEVTGFSREFIDVDEFSFELCMIEMDVKQQLQR